MNLPLIPTIVDDTFISYLKRLAASIATGWNVEHEADGTHKPGIAFAPRTYPATVASVENSTTETAVIRFEVGADEMADGDVLQITAACTTKNGTAGARTPTLKFYWGRAIGTLTTQGWSNAGNENKNVLSFLALRVGSEVWVREHRSPSPNPPRDTLAGYDLGSAITNSQFVEPIVGCSFDVRQPVQVTVTLDAASPVHYWKFHSARVMKVGS